MDAIRSLSPWQTACLAAYALVVAVSFLRVVVCAWEVRRTRFLSTESPKAGWDTVPLVSIMVPAKDEAESIQDCLRSLMRQDYRRFEILVVDDRSTDATPHIVQQLAAEDPRVRLIRVFDLPPGWTGKTHALDVCRKHARGEWYLFVDADTRHDPTCLSVVMREALDEGADMLSLLPAIDARTFWERAVQPVASACLLWLYPLRRVNNPACRQMGFANGQFILVHRQAYEAIGGHAGVRGQFVEDIHLGRGIRERGLNLRVAVGSSLASVRMYSTLAEIIRGWSRILYSAVDCRPARLRMLMGALCTFSVLPYAVLAGSGAALAAGWAPSFSAALCGLALAQEASQWALHSRLYAASRMPRRYLAFRLLGVFAMLHILRRTVQLCRTHEVTWRGTTYTRTLKRAA